MTTKKILAIPLHDPRTEIDVQYFSAMPASIFGDSGKVYAGRIRGWVQMELPPSLATSKNLNREAIRTPVA